MNTNDTFAALVRERSTHAVIELRRLDAFLARTLTAVSAPNSGPDRDNDASGRDERGDLRYGIDLMPGAGLESAVTYGWHKVEPWGVWSAASVAILALSVGRRPERSFVLRVDFGSCEIFPAEHSAEVLINGDVVATLRFEARVATNPLLLRIKPSQITSTGMLDVQFVVKDLFGVGSDDDPRLLGIPLCRIGMSPDIVSDPLRPVLDELADLTMETGLANVFLSGWHPPDKYQVWSAESRPLIGFRLSRQVAIPCTFEVEIAGFNSPGRPQLVEIRIGRRGVGVLLFEDDVIRRMTIPILGADLSSENDVDIWFDVSDPQSPHEVGRGSDTRLLGITILALRYIGRVEAEKSSGRTGHSIGFSETLRRTNLDMQSNETSVNLPRYVVNSRDVLAVEIADSYEIELDEVGEFRWIGGSNVVRFRFLTSIEGTRACHIRLRPHPNIDLRSGHLIVCGQPTEFDMIPFSDHVVDVAFLLPEHRVSAIVVDICGIEPVCPAHYGENDDQRFLLARFYLAQFV